MSLSLSMQNGISLVSLFNSRANKNRSKTFDTRDDKETEKLKKNDKYFVYSISHSIHGRNKRRICGIEAKLVARSTACHETGSRPRDHWATPQHVTYPNTCHAVIGGFLASSHSTVIAKAKAILSEVGITEFSGLNPMGRESCGTCELFFQSSHAMAEAKANVRGLLRC